MEESTQKEDVILMRTCIDDAKRIVLEKRLLESQNAVVQIAIALFNERSNQSKK